MTSEYGIEPINFLEENPDYAVVRCEGYCIDSKTDKILCKVGDCNHDKDNPYIFENGLMEKNFNFG